MLLRTARSRVVCPEGATRWRRCARTLVHWVGPRYLSSQSSTSLVRRSLGGTCPESKTTWRLSSVRDPSSQRRGSWLVPSGLARKTAPAPDANLSRLAVALLAKGVLRGRRLTPESWLSPQGSEPTAAQRPRCQVYRAPVDLHLCVRQRIDNDRTVALRPVRVTLAQDVVLVDTLFCHPARSRPAQHHGITASRAAERSAIVVPFGRGVT